MQRVKKSKINKISNAKSIVKSTLSMRSELYGKFPNALGLEGNKVFLELLDSGKITEHGASMRIKKLECKERLLQKKPALLDSRAGVKVAVSIIRESVSADEVEIKLKRINAAKQRFSQALSKAELDDGDYFPVMAGKN